MGKLKFIPAATIALIFLVVFTYFALSQGTLFIPTDTLEQASVALSSNPLAVIAYMFVHVGILHLLSNLIPLALFAYIVERKFGTRDTLLLFFIAGIAAASVFTLLNPNTLLIGASAAIAGFIGASILITPKNTLISLLLSLAIVSLAAPVASFAVETQKAQLAYESTSLQTQVNDLVRAGRVDEAHNVSATVVIVQQQQTITTEGQKRESETPSDLIVHIVGGLTGIVYVLCCRKDLLPSGINEFQTIGKRIHKFIKTKKKK